MDIKKTPPQVVPYIPAIPGFLAGLYNRVAGDYCGVTGSPATVTIETVVADKIYAYPFLVLKSEAFDRISIYINTLSVGNARLGIYNNVVEGVKPGTLVLDAGEIDTGTTGLKEIVINQVLEPGLYWLAILYSATPVVKSTGAVLLAPNIFGITGNNADAGGNYAMYYTAQSYGALPATHPTPVARYLGTQGICLRRA